MSDEKMGKLSHSTRPWRTESQAANQLIDKPEGQFCEVGIFLRHNILRNISRVYGGNSHSDTSCNRSIPHAGPQVGQARFVLGTLATTACEVFVSVHFSKSFQFYPFLSCGTVHIKLAVVCVTSETLLNYQRKALPASRLALRH
jgi:hypothetical protein